MIVGAMASTELVRFLRRREGLALPVGLTLLGALPLVVGLNHQASNPFEAPLDAEATMSDLRSVLSIAEMAIAAILAHVLAATSLSLEHRRGSWSLLVQSVATPGRILVGKGLGVLGCVAIAHAGFMLAIMTTTPLVTREPAAVAFEAIVPLLLALAALPGGLAEAQVRRAGHGYGAFRTISALQWTSPLLILAALLAPLGPEGAIDVLGALAWAAATASPLVGLRETIPTTGLLLALVFIVQAGFALLIWRLFVVNPRYA